MSDASAPTGLILTGGGARAAYQIGVLQEILNLRRTFEGEAGNPFEVICGTSSGAINASVLACGADTFESTLSDLAQVWKDFQVHQVYRSDVLDMLQSGARWVSLLTLGWLMGRKRFRPRSLLDNAPLGELLQERVDFRQLPRVLKSGHLRALAITASNYDSGEHVTFYQSDSDIQPWVRNQRAAMRCELQLSHLLASSGIPFIFPAARLEGPQGPAWFGDGAMRQTAPIAPAIHLGAQRVLVIGAGRMHEPRRPATRSGSDYPSMARIAGHALSSIFLDALAVDVERLQRINHTLSLIPAESRAQSTLRPVELLVIAPSQRLDDIALRHAHRLPGTVQQLLKILGGSAQSGSSQGGALISYLLFESLYTQELIALGREDARAKSAEIEAFFGWRIR